MRILLFADGLWASDSLARLIECGHSIIGVVLRSHPSGPELENAAEERGIPIFQPANVNNPEFRRQVQKLGPELGLSIAYNQIFRPSLFEAFERGIVNFHAGKLPFYRGRNVINWAIINGEKEIGLTSHFVDQGIDTGHIILQETYPIGWTDGYGDVLGRLVTAFPNFVERTLELIQSKSATPHPQSLEEGTYFPGRGPDDEWLDWDDTSVNLHNKIRAITRPAPGARTLLGDSEIRIWRAFYDPSWPRYIATPGVVVGRCADGVRVKTRDSSILIQEIQLPGKTPELPTWRPGIRLGLNIPFMLVASKAKFQSQEFVCSSGDCKL